MGQKVNPISYRLQISKDWSSKWFTKKADFRRWLVDFFILSPQIPIEQ